MATPIPVKPVEDVLRDLSTTAKRCVVAKNALKGFCNLNSSSSTNDSIRFAAEELVAAKKQLLEYVRIFADAVDHVHSVLDGADREEES